MKRALVVEDDDVLRSAVCGALSDAGFDTLGCSDLTLARRHLRESSPPDVVILDLAVGEEFADGFLAELCALTTRPAIVVCSGFALGHLVAARYGVPFLRKPFELDALLAAATPQDATE